MQIDGPIVVSFQRMFISTWNKQRGVAVKIILPGHTDSALVFHAGRSHYMRILESGIEIYERHDKLLHAKTVFIDRV